MNPGGNPVLALIWTFGLMSLFAVGGANSAIPEMHRVAVDVQHWMTDKQFADMYAISQLSPGPNVLIVTLIGYSVGGVAGGLVATLAMCAPTAVPPGSRVSTASRDNASSRACVDLPEPSPPSSAIHALIRRRRDASLRELRAATGAQEIVPAQAPATSPPR